jgi:hypothetical protein
VSPDSTHVWEVFELVRDRRLLRYASGSLSLLAVIGLFNFNAWKRFNAQLLEITKDSVRGYKMSRCI